MKADKRIIWAIYIFTAVVYGLVILLHELPKAEGAPSWMKFLPLVNATFNGSCSVLLISSLIAIKNRNVALHKSLNTSAMVLSVLFLLSYVTYHYFAGDTIYQGDNKGLYYFILVSHILLAGLSLPFILMAYYFGYIGLIEKHKKLVRFTYPIWLYVTITGVVVYSFLAPYYE